MKTIILALAKKYIIKSINELLDDYKCDVQRVAVVIGVWITRLQTIIAYLQKILDRVSDGKIEDEEVDASVEEIEAIVREW